MCNQDQIIDEAHRQELLANYKATDHLLRWKSKDRSTGQMREVVYYPAGWRLYELGLRYPTANFTSDIHHMNEDKDFVIVKVRLFIGADYATSVKKAEAFKQGKLSELDKVETKAKARACRDFGVGTELALDMDDIPDGEEIPTEQLVRERCTRLRITFESLVAKVNSSNIKNPLNSPLQEEDCVRLMKALDYMEANKPQVA